MYKATIKVPLYAFTSNAMHTNTIEQWARDNCKSYAGFDPVMRKNVYCWEFSFEDVQDQIIFLLRWG